MSTGPAPGAGPGAPVDDVPGAFADLVAEVVAARPGPRCTLVLSGGPTARACYERLAGLPAGAVDWSVVDVYMGDERLVPPDDPDANQRLVHEALIDPVGGVGSFTPMPTDGAPEACAARYQAVMGAVLAGPGIDLVHLGMGPDGHTASLFPGATTLEAGPDTLVVATADPNGRNPHPRLSLTLPAIDRARLAVFTVAGEAKAAAVARLRAGEDLPAGRVRADEVRWLVDAAAFGPPPRRGAVTAPGPQPGAAEFSELAGLGADDLAPAARKVRDRAHGNRVTYSPKVFIPLTMLCRDRCGYCTFAKAPARLAAPYLTIDQVLAVARAGRAAGCHEALFTLGERPELRYPSAAAWLAANGYESTVDYLVAACAAVLEETGLLPHANAGALFEGELAALRAVSAGQGMMLESLADGLAAHRRAPDKAPGRRLATLEAAGRLAIPFTTGILVGIGETRADRLAALAAIAESHRRHGHVQEVIVQNFLPKAGTAMHAQPPCPPEELRWSIAAARLVLPPEVHVQAPPNLSDDLAPLLDAGIDDWGGVSPVTADHVNPERAWPALDSLRAATEAAGHSLAARLTIYPAFALEPGRWLDPALRFAVLDAADAEGLGREDPWCSGGTEAPPDLLAPAGTDGAGAPGRPRPARGRAGTARAGTAVAEVLAGVALGQEVGEAEIVTLFSARGPEVRAVAEVADQLRTEANGDEVTFVKNRNINYTNVCTFKCRFCAFSKGPRSLNLRGAPYLLDLEEITRRVAEAEAVGATEVCLQGGIHPDFDGDYYVDVLGAVRAASERIHIHGFTALEVTEGARRSGVPLADYLRRLQAAGLKTLPGTAAEILDDPVRQVLCPDKIDTDQWLEAHRTAHQVGLRSNVTIMFGAVEQPVSWARHLVRTRALQRETGGFTEFVPLPFVHMATPIYLQRRARRGPTFREALLMHAVGRIAYRGAIDSIQVSWVKTGVAGARQVLMAGANDVGGTLMDENISRAAGAAHGQGMAVDDLAALVAPLGRPLVQRTTLYARVPGGAVAPPRAPGPATAPGAPAAGRAPGAPGVPVALGPRAGRPGSR